MADYITKHQDNFANAEIAASGSETFLSSENNRAQFIKNNQNFNSLLVVNNGANTINIDLDGLTTRRYVLFGNSTLIINPEDEIFFNNVKVTNTSTTSVITAAALNGYARLMKKVLTPVVSVKGA